MSALESGGLQDRLKELSFQMKVRSYHPSKTLRLALTMSLFMRNMGQ